MTKLINIHANAMGAFGIDFVSDDSLSAKKLIAIQPFDGSATATFTVDCGNNVSKTFTKTFVSGSPALTCYISNLNVTSGEMLVWYAEGEAE